LGAGFVGTGNDNTTLLTALSFKGGNTLQDAKNNLMRAAAAAYLNSKALNYPVSTGTLVFVVNLVLATNDRDTILSLQGAIDKLNNGQCVLN
jgi:hypothetical protein